MADERYNNGLAYKIFKEELKDQVEWLEYLGATRKDISEYIVDAEEWFKDERKYYEKTISYNQYTNGMEEEGYSPLLPLGFDNLVTYIETKGTGYFSWIYSLDNAERVKIIKTFSTKQKVFLTEVTQKGKTYIEVSQSTGYSRQTVSVNMKKIYDKLKPCYEQEYVKAERRFEYREKYKTQHDRKRKKIYDEELQCEREMLNVELRHLINESIEE